MEEKTTKLIYMRVTLDEIAKTSADVASIITSGQVKAITPQSEPYLLIMI